MSLRSQLKINTYGIRSSLGRSKWSTQIQFGANTSWSFAKKPVTLGSLGLVFLCVVMYVLIYQFTVIKQGGFLGITIFTIGYLMLFILLGTRTPTLNYKTSYLPALFMYWRKGGRFVPTFFAARGGALKNLLGIDEDKGIEENGLIHFANGECGMILDVIGHASSMIFANDQKAVIDDARVVYKNLPPLVGLTLVTQASTQDVHTQIHAKINQLRNLQIDSPGLRQVVKKQGLVLRDTVGDKFSMIRQYLIVRGDASNVGIEVRQLQQSSANLTSSYLKSVKVLTNEPLRKGIDGLPLNEPYQVHNFLGSIFNDYQGK